MSFAQRMIRRASQIHDSQAPLIFLNAFGIEQTGENRMTPSVLMHLSARFLFASARYRLPQPRKEIASQATPINGKNDQVKGS
jgi:hypothetical protein